MDPFQGLFLWFAKINGSEIQRFWETNYFWKVMISVVTWVISLMSLRTYLTVPSSSFSSQQDCEIRHHSWTMFSVCLVFPVCLTSFAAFSTGSCSLMTWRAFKSQKRLFSFLPSWRFHLSLFIYVTSCSVLFMNTQSHKSIMDHVHRYVCFSPFSLLLF